MNKKVLVVDDEKAYMNLMVSHLNKRGYEAVGTTDPKEGLEIFKKERGFAVIVTDWMMPELTGNELILAVQQIDPKVQAIVITAFGQDMQTPSSIPGWGNFKHLDKPLARMSELSEAVQKAIEFREKLYPD